MTDSDSGGSSAVVLKRDARGRVRTTAAQRAELLAQYERSGLSGPAFARVAGVNYQTFAWWRQQEQRKARVALMPACPKTGAESIRLVEAALPAMTSRAGNAALEVLLPGGAHMMITDAAQVALAAQLIQALA